MTDDPRLGALPVEPMSDIAWSRVERGLWSRMDAGGSASPAASTADRTGGSRRWWPRWWIVAVPLAAAAVIAIVVGLRVTIQVAGSDEPAYIVTGPAPSEVTFSDSLLEVDAYTSLAMSHESGHPLVQLERGAAWFSVTPRGSRPEFKVRAGDAVVRVVGTRFRVARSGERIAVTVDRGVVDVQFRGRVVAVGAGQRWSSESPTQPSSVAMAPAAAVSGAPEDPDVEIDPTDDVSPPARTPREPKRTPKPVVKSAPAGSAAGSTPDAAHAADINRERLEYERLAALEPRFPDAALSGYITLAQGTSRWAGLALYAAARLAADRQLDRRARTLLEVYLQRFPGGANAEDARQLLLRLKTDHSRGEDHP